MAQKPGFRFDKLGPEQGLKENITETVLQDSYGYIWIATADGLFRYDGYTCANYKHIDGDTNTLIHNHIYNITEDSEKRLWIGYRFGGMSLYSRNTDSFKNIAFADSNMTNEVFKNSLRDIFEDNEKNIWVLNAYGIAKLPYGQKKWIWYKQSSEGINLENHYSYAICQSVSGHIYVGFRDFGALLIYNKQKDAFSEIKLHPTQEDQIMPQSITTMCQDIDGSLWIGTVESGGHKINLNKKSIKPYTEDAGILAKEIMHIYLDSQNRLWIGSSNGGLFLYDRMQDRFFNYKTEDGINSISSNSISRITEDNKGNIWLTTHQGGVNIINQQKNLFELYQKDVCNAKGLHSNTVACFYEEGPQTLWVGTDGGGLHKLDRQTKTIEHFGQDEGFSSNVILDIEPNGDGKLWLATWGSGIILFNPKTGSSKNYAPQSGNSISFQNVKGILKDGKYLWIGTHGRGVCILDTETGHFYDNNDKAPGINFDYSRPYWLNSINKDSRGNIWLTTSLGLYIFSEGKLLEFYTGETTSSSPRGNIINTVFEDSKNRIWIGSNGLDLYTESDESFTNYNEKLPALPTLIRSITEDNKGNLWLGSNSGLYKFSPENNTVEHYTEAFGLQSNQFTERASLLLSDGSIAVGGNNGFNIFDPSSIVQDTSQVKIYIDACYIWNSNSNATGSTKENILLKNTTTINYLTSRMLSFGFTGIHLQASGQIEYSYKLDGFDSEWHSVGANRQVTYTNLEPGTYTFQARAKIPAGQWTTQPAEYTFTIAAPWYMTWWFRTAAVLGIILIAGLIIILRIYRMKQYQRQLTQKVHERTWQLEDANLEMQEQREEIREQYTKLLESKNLIKAKNRELSETIALKDKLVTTIAHDLKNSLSTVTGFVKLITDQKLESTHPKLKEYTGFLSNSSAKLENQFMDLIEWAKSRSTQTAYSPEQLNLNSLIRDTASMFSEKASLKNISIKLNTDTHFACFADRRMLNSVVKNIIGNAIKFTPKGGEIHIWATESEQSMLITVEDSGIGLSKQQIEEFESNKSISSISGTNAEEGSGIGLKICYEFITICKGTINLKSTINKGTTVSISLPKGEPIATPTEIAKNQNNIKASIPEMTMLIADDNFEIISLLSELFKNSFKIETASNGAEALVKATQYLPDIVISDIYMPEMHGTELCEKLKRDRLTSHIPVILITGQTNDDNELIAIKSGANDCIDKPINHEILISKVNNIVQSQLSLREQLKNELVTTTKESNLPESKDDALLKAVRELVADNIKTPDLSVEFIAEKVGLSRSHLYRKFKAILGYSPVEYIRLFRIQKAAELLKQNRYRVSEVAYDVGFSDPKYFSSCFKKEFGVSPSEYQNKSK